MNKIAFTLTLITDDDVSSYSDDIISKIMELIPNVLEIGDDIIFLDAMEMEVVL